jgi:hypothetical protein
MKGKNLRLLGLEESPNRQPTIQEIISDLQNEIERGESVYTVDEIRLLERKLADYEQLSRSLSS